VITRIGHHPAMGAAKFVARELAATVRVAAAAPRGWRGRTHTQTNRGTEAGRAAAPDLVVLVHGFMATAAAFAPLVDYLRLTEGLPVRTFSYHPGSTLDGISRRIHHAIRSEEGALRVHLVGHSLGGLAVRWYVQEHHHDPRVVQTISIASPFFGVELADLFPDALRALAFPRAGAIRRIVRNAADHLERVPHLSIVADKDQLIRPTHAGILPGAPSFLLHDTGHNGTLYHRKLPEIVGKEIRRLARPRRGTTPSVAPSAMEPRLAVK